MSLLSIRNLHASIGEKEILKGVNLEINCGEVHSIMGPNGNGKSTLAGIIAGNTKYTVTQGEVIYWKYQGYEPEGSERIGKEFSRLSGYALELTPYESGYAGYKDWFIQDFNRPGYTIEAGQGSNPLPLKQLPEIYRKNVDLLSYAQIATAETT